MKEMIVNGRGGKWRYRFRKVMGRPVEMLKEHVELGSHGGWQVARNFCLQGLGGREKIAAYFGLSTL